MDCVNTSGEVAMDEIVKYESGLSIEKHNALANAFNPFVESIQDTIKEAQSVEVTGADDKQSMKKARELRLKLRAVRVDVEKTRKDLKESALREGKAIDGMANIIKYMIAPVENRLQEQEDYAKRMEELRIAELSEARRAVLDAFDVDSEHFDLGHMPEEAFEQLRLSSEAGFNAKVEAERKERERQEAERIAKEKAEQERREKERQERERIEAENAMLRAEKEKAEAEALKERQRIEAERKKAEAEAEALRQAQAERDRKESEAKAAAEMAEVARLKAEKEAEQARLAAPDNDKIAALVTAICALSIPSVSSDIAMDALHDVRGILNSAVKRLRKACKDLSEVKG